MVVSIKVKSGAACKRSMALPASYFVTVKDGFVYIRGNVEGKVVCVKIRLSEVLGQLKVKVADAGGSAKLQLLATGDQTRARLLALGAGAKSAAGDRNVQVTAASAVGGAAAGGTTGGAAGLLAGGV